MTNFNFKFMETFLRYMDSNGNTLDLNGSQVDDDFLERIETLETEIKAALINESASGAVASFADGSDGVPVTELIVNIEPIQEGTGDPSPENVRPISGRTAVNIWRDDAHDTTADPNITIQLGDTVYGGTLNVTNGKVVATMGMSDMGIINWSYYERDQYFYGIIGSRFPNGVNGKGLCTVYDFYGTSTGANLVANMPDKSFGFTNSSSHRYIYVKDSSYTDAASFAAAVNGQQIVYDYDRQYYEEISTIPAQLTTLLGQNYIWADSGNVSVKYVADTKLYIDAATAALTANTQNNNRETEKPDVIKEEVKDDSINEEKEI